MRNIGVTRLVVFFALFGGGLSLPAGPHAAQSQPSAGTSQAPRVPGVLATQILLDRAGFSPGQIDGLQGENMRRALQAFGRVHQIHTVDEAALRQASPTTEPLLVDYVITPEDTAGPFTPEIPQDPMAQAALPALGYTSVLEQLAERVHSAPELLRRLNPSATWTSGESVHVPNVASAGPTDGSRPSRASLVVVSRAASGLTVYDERKRVIFFAPVTSGSEHDPLPLGRWSVTAVVRNPPFNYNPSLFWDADATQGKAKLPPGPNGPVGTVWIDLNKPHYGIHGTAEPGQVGHTMSHGCVRLTNWDAETVAALVHKGTEVRFVR